MTKKKQLVDNEEEDLDNPHSFPVLQSLSELIDIYEQKIKTVPKSEKFYDIWRSEMNNLIREINSKSGFKLYKPV